MRIHSISRREGLIEVCCSVSGTLGLMRATALRVMSRIVLGCALLTRLATAGVAAERPNIVFVLADDLGYQELGSFGQKKIQTPHLDQLAAEGMRLTQHYSGNAVCAPSRCVLLTGRHPGHATIRDNSEVKPEGQWPLHDSDITIAEQLKAVGYATGAFGKWGLGGPGSEGDPINQGFDTFFGYNCQRHAHSYYPDYLWSNSERVALKNSPPVPGHARLPQGADPTDPASYSSFKGEDYAPARIREEALQFIRKHRDEPFFLYYPSPLPHLALHVPDEELAPYHGQGWNDPPFSAENGGYTPHFTPRAAYAAMISHLDADVGALRKQLTDLNLDQNTIFIFSADNGTTHVNKEVDAAFFNSVGELRGMKGSLYEGGVRVPTIVKWSGHIAAGSSSDFVSGFEDWFPTLLEIASGEAAMTDKAGGVSLRTLLTTGSQESRRFLYREFPGYGGQQSIRMGDWKAVRQQMAKGTLRTQLYHMANDPGELQDVASEHAEVVQSMEREMEACRIPSERFPLRPLDKPVPIDEKKRR